nr:uncharacterized protein LOC113808036 [Penaeus vannamei]
MVENFYNFFANVGKEAYEKSRENLPVQESEEIITNANDEIQNANIFRLNPVDCNTAILTIESLKESNSYDSDGISYRFIKDSLPVIVFYIKVILNTSIVTNTFPDSWKLSHVIPLYKGCDKDNSQYGFRQKLSTDNALMKVSDKIYDNIDKKKLSLLILLDLSKAFDGVNHKILMKKIKILNIDPL